MTNEEIRRLAMEAMAKVTGAAPDLPAQQPPPSLSEVRSGGTLVLLPPYTAFPREAFLQGLIGAGQVILAGFGSRSSTNFQYWDLSTPEGTGKLLDNLADFGGVYLYAPGFSAMAKLTALEDEDPLARLLIQRLLSGKEAGICLEQNPAAVSPGLKTRLEAAIQALKTLGFSVLCVSCGGAAVKGEEKQAECASKEVLLEEDILALHQRGHTSIQLGEGAILTPLAADRARELGMEIER